MRNFLSYVFLLFFLVVSSIAARYLLIKSPEIAQEVDFQLFVFGGILFAGYYINRIAPKTLIPSFVWAIFAGMALQPLLGFYTHHIDGFKMAIEVMAAFILFAGGLEIPFKNFQKWFFPIASLSLVGIVVSAVTSAALMLLLLSITGNYTVSLIPSIIILAAALSSTDPTAIIPTLKTMHFKRKFLKDIAITESALTDVSGSILTRFLLIALISVPIAQQSEISSYLKPLFQKAAYDALALQIMTGILVGYIGYALLRKFYMEKQDEVGDDSKQDPALLLSVPLFTFVVGNVLGGAGFLASFVSGLISEANGGLKKVSHFYGSLLDHLIKPFIFISLGALVPLSTLLDNAFLGITIGLFFIFIVRPSVVFMSLFPWFISGTFRFKDLLFLSLIRETGIISAVLIVIASAFNIINSDFVISMGMWVILLTLVLEPPLTPYLARKIGVVT